jgi:hydrogenase maturation protease
LGNALLKDDGVGVHAVRAIIKEPIEGTRAVEVGTAVLDALHLLERADKVIALDAVQGGETPGSIYELRFKGGKKSGHGGSIHELGLREAMAMLPEDQRPEWILLGMEPECIEYGLELSPTLEAALPRFIKTLRDTAEDWLNR